MADFLDVTLADGTRVLFQAAESDLVRAHSGAPQVDEVADGVGRIEDIARAAGSLCESFRKRLAPDELTMEIGVGLSGEVGWFFAKSAMNAGLKLTITWKPGTRGAA
jgi:hypothetical protein